METNDLRITFIIVIVVLYCTPESRVCEFIGTNQFFYVGSWKLEVGSWNVLFSTSSVNFND